MSLLRPGKGSNSRGRDSTLSVTANLSFNLAVGDAERERRGNPRVNADRKGEQRL